ncbi:MAG: enolase C-terminal domain-like protein [Bacteriovoracia bacterium]
MTSSFSFAVYERNFTAPFRYGQETLTSRRGVIIRRHNSEGSFVCSEASPLAGHSSDRLEEVIQTLEHSSSAQLEMNLIHSEKSADLPASLRFALEGIAIQSENYGNFQPVHSNALLPWLGPEQTLSRFRILQREGYRTFKVKISDESISQIPIFLKSIPDTGWKVRLDGNRALSPAPLAQFFQEVSRLELAGRIDYLEEPLAGWQHPLLRESPLALAADESAGSPQAALRLLETPNCPQVFILKPTVLGGLASVSPLASQLKRAGRRAVYTSALETEPGRRSIIALLGREGAGEVHGLSTGFLFRTNLLPDVPLYGELPVISMEEKQLWQALDWRGCP